MNIMTVSGVESVALREPKLIAAVWGCQIDAEMLQIDSRGVHRVTDRLFLGRESPFWEDIHWMANGPRLQLAALGGN